MDVDEYLNCRSPSHCNSDEHSPQRSNPAGLSVSVILPLEILDKVPEHIQAMGTISGLPTDLAPYALVVTWHTGTGQRRLFCLDSRGQRSLYKFGYIGRSWADQIVDPRGCVISTEVLATAGNLFVCSEHCML